MPSGSARVDIFIPLLRCLEAGPARSRNQMDMCAFCAWHGPHGVHSDERGFVMTGDHARSLGPALRRHDPEALLRRYHAERRPEDLERLVETFRPLARKLALRYARGSDPIDDLEQIACMGLVKALQRFDPERGFAFTSFAVPTILGEIKRSFRDTAWAVRVPRQLQEHVAEVRLASETFAALAGRSPAVSELVAETGLSQEDIVEALQAAAAGEEEATSILDRMGAEEEGYVRIDDRDAIAHALPALTDLQRRVLDLRFSEGLRQSDIAERLGVSQMQISRVLRASIDRLGIVADHQSRVAA
jgi:RNA polymerase sigma-B factor